MRLHPTVKALLLVLPAVLLWGVSLTACSAEAGKPDPKVASVPEEAGRPAQALPQVQPQVQPPVTPPPANPPAPDALTSSGLPSVAAGALRKYIRGDDRYTLAHWVAVENGYYLVEMHQSPSEEHLYLWVSSDGKTADVFLGFAENGVFADYANGKVHILCTRVGDAYSAYPYYEVARPGGKPEEAVFFKTANAGSYVASSPGMAYELRKATSTATTLDLLFMITGAEPGGSMAGGPRPPLARINESPGSVVVRLSYVTLAPGVEEAIRGFTSDCAKVTGVAWIDGSLEVRFSVAWKYAVTFTYEKVERQSGDMSGALNGYRFCFLPKAQDPAAGGATLHQAATSIAGVRIGGVEVTAPRLVNDLQQHLLRAFPARGEPGSGQSAADVALLTAGQWREEKQAYIPTGEGRPSLIRWQGRWYELEPAFDALWKTAQLPDRDRMGETPDAVMKRYLQAQVLRDWAAAYECLARVPKDITLSSYVDEMRHSGDSYVDARIMGYSLKAEDSATVYVTYTYRWSNGAERTFEKEPWACVREDGVWKVRWLPRQ